MDVEIEYCVPCGHLDRALEMAGVLLREFGGGLDGVRLRTGSGGVFKIRVDGEEIFDAQRDGWDPDSVRDDVARRLAA